MDKIIRTLNKNALEQIRIGLTEFKGYQLAYIRIFYQAGPDEWKPSPKGITFQVHLLPEVIEGPTMAAKELPANEE